MKDRESLSPSLSLFIFDCFFLFRGIYDYDYMNYTIRILVKCSDYGFEVFMDPHQDTVRSLYLFSCPANANHGASSGLVSQAAMALPFGH